MVCRFTRGYQWLNMETVLSAENSACFESLILRGHPGTLAGYSVERASAVFRYDEF
jgi:hypothetical protein